MGEGLGEEVQSRLQQELQDVASSSRRRLEAIKLSQLLKPPEMEESRS
jgi:hypothetical protein